MNAKTLTYLAGAAIVALAAAIAINVSRRPESEANEKPKALLPELHDHVNDVNQITLTGAEGKTLATLKRTGDAWNVVEKANYPADLAKIREFLIKLDQATILEQKTSNPKLYAELGVDDVKDKDAKGVLVELAGLPQPVKLIVGNYNGAGGGGTFVRRDGDAQSWLAKGNIAVAKNTADWEMRDLADIPSNRLKSVTLTNPDGKTLAAAKEQPGDANFKVADVPKGREVSSEFAANGLASTLAGLKADDVFPAKDMPPPDKVYKAQYAAFDGLVIDVTAWDKDGKDYAELAARLDTAAANAQIDKDQAKAKADYDAAVDAANKKLAEEKSTSGPEAQANAKAASQTEIAKPLAVSDPAKDRRDKLDALNKEVETLNKTFSGWTFVLPGYKFSNINKTMDDMLKPVETKKPDAAKEAKPAAKTPPKPAAKGA
ncbi:MAG TPA: DUF4340 domain-containing protein [Rudaea sp.]|nr:DUF4340 domain-containing protein [Rudaea sp.]